jgi:hypothetical protein
VAGNPRYAVPTYNEIEMLLARAGHLHPACETMERIPVGVARGEAARAIMKAAAAKMSAEQVANVIAGFRTPEERASGYLGLAEGMIDQQKNVGSGAAMAGIKD